MKIALVSPYMTTAFNNPAYYNSQQINIAKNLASLGNQVTIFTKKLDDIKDEVFDYSNGGSYNIYYLDPVSTFGHWIVLKGLLKKIGHSYDIIMVNEDFQFTTLQLSYFKKKLRSKLVIFQGVYEFPEKRFWNIIMRGYSLFFSGYIIKRCDLVIAKTEAAKVFMEKKGYKEVIRVPIGVDTDIFYRQPLTKKDYFLYVGDLVKRRDLGTIIKGIKAANKRLLVIGDGEEKEKLKKFAEDLNVDVDFLGKVENKLLSKYYSEAQGFIFASTYEIFGMVLLEAIQTGVIYQ